MRALCAERAALSFLIAAIAAVAVACASGGTSRDRSDGEGGEGGEGGHGGSDAPPPGPPPDPTQNVFDTETLHTIDIEVADQYLAQLDADTENRVPCKVTFDDQVIENAGCRKKGGFGSVQPLSGKTGFSLKFDEFDKGKELFGMKRLLLNNAIQDPGFLNEHVGYEAYRQAGIPAARTAHGVMRFNGLTKGIFVIAEPIEKRFLARHFGDANKEGNLYEGPATVDFVTNTAGMDLKDEVDEMRSRDDIIALAALVQSTPDATFIQDVGAKVDLDVFIRGYAIDSICDHWDGYSMVVINNYYMFDNPATGRFFFMPHGMDQLFQDINYNVDTAPNGFLAKRVRGIPELDMKFHTQIADVLEKTWDVPFLLARIDKVSRVIATNTNMDQAALDNVASYNQHVAGERYAVAYRKALLLGQPMAVCGDGTVQPGEACDDANMATGDGCSSACFAENCIAVAHEGANYLFCPTPVSQYSGRLECAAYGGSLVVPMTADENEWIKKTASAVVKEALWIGANDESIEGTYRAPGGEKLGFFDWGKAQPGGGFVQNCVAIDPTVDGWNDKDCREAYGVICRVP